jgi:hypothetical protein
MNSDIDQLLAYLRSPFSTNLTSSGNSLPDESLFFPMLKVARMVAIASQTYLRQVSTSYGLIFVSLSYIPRMSLDDDRDKSYDSNKSTCPTAKRKTVTNSHLLPKPKA